MKLKKIYTMMAGAAMMLAACSPDDFDFGAAQYSSDDLKCPDAYTVTIDGNYVTLESKLKGCTPLWVTPNGRSQEQKLTLGLPFAGDYEVTLGAETRAGVVYGEPYQFSISQNDFAQLSDEIWANLAGGVGKSKKWVPCNANYGVGRCSGPVMYGNPDDVKNDGSNSTDMMFGSANWAPNWDPGFQSWLIPADDPYMNSYMEFGLDAQNGCTAKVFRNDGNGGTPMNGKFNLNVSDKTHPVISFSDCYSLHNAAFDEVCSNYTQDVKIIECTPYLLQIATMRTNSEGPWWIIWNFVSQEVIDTNGECIPKEESGLIEKTEPELPTFSNLTTDLFTTEINGVTYVGNQMTFIINDETPYDWMWWNGSPAVSKWENVANGDNFVKLAKEGYFDGTLFHRVIRDFMIQGGDPDSKGAPAGKNLGTGGPDYTIPAEFVFPKLYHKRGALSAARTGDEVNPNRESSGSQFYIVWGKTYKPAELKQMERQLAMQQEQAVFNQLVADNKAKIMELRRNRDRAGLQELQDDLIASTKAICAEKGLPKFTDEQVESYTTVGGTPFLDNQYTVFGEVEEGLEIVGKIQEVETGRNDRPKDDVVMLSVEVI